MNDKMKLMMDEAWKQWHGNDIDTPKTSPAFERGFRVALEMLAPVIEDLLLAAEAAANCIAELRVTPARAELAQMLSAAIEKARGPAA